MFVLNKCKQHMYMYTSINKQQELDKYFATHTCFIKEYMSDSFTNYNYVGNKKISVSIKKLMPTNAH